MAGSLSRNLSNITEITKLMQECKSMDINVLGPDVNESHRKFSVNKQGDIRFGLCAVKGVGENAVQSIINEREAGGPYTSIFNFVERVNLTACNRKNLECLALSGAFDELPGGIKREQYMGVNSKGEPFLDTLIRYGNRFQQDKNSSQNSLFGAQDMPEIPTPEIPVAEEWSTLSRLNKERELVGIYLSAHPLDEYALVLNEFCNTRAIELADKNALAGRKITMGGLVADPPRTGFTKKGKPYGIVGVEDFSGKAEIALFGDDWIQKQNYFIPGNFVYINGACQPKQWDPDSYDFVINNIRLLSEVKDESVKSITLSFPIELLTVNVVEDMMEFIRNNPGKSKINFNIRDVEQEFTLSLVSLDYSINITQEFIDFIKGLDGFEYKLN